MAMIIILFEPLRMSSGTTVSRWASERSWVISLPCHLAWCVQRCSCSNPRCDMIWHGYGY